MTFKKLKNLTTGLLIGDNKFPQDDEVAKALLSFAFNKIANKAESLHLMTLNKDKDILRTATGDYLMRVPNDPEGDGDELDIDDELGYVAALYMASSLSKNKSSKHESDAEALIIQYNGKVEAMLASFREIEEGDRKGEWDVGQYNV